MLRCRRGWDPKVTRPVPWDYLSKPTINGSVLHQGLATCLRSRDIPPLSSTQPRGRFPNRLLVLKWFLLSHVTFRCKRQPPRSSTQQSTPLPPPPRAPALCSTFLETFPTNRQRYMYLTRYSPIDEDSPNDHTQKNTYIHALVF